MFPSVDIRQGDKKGAVMPCAFFPALLLGDSADTLELRNLAGLATKVPFRRGKTIFEEGAGADFAFGVSQGIVRLYKLLPDGRRHIVAFALPGDFLGVPLAERHSCSADAVGEVSLCRFSRDQLERLIRNSPKLTSLLLDFAARKLDMARDQQLLLGNGSAEEKVAIFLVDWRKRLERLVPVARPLPLPMPRQDIADFLGLKLETVSRTLAKLEQKNVIHLVRKGVFLNGLQNTALVTGRSPQPRAGIRWTDDPN
jgi:CRP/FNR family transcriptional regulator, anaerobic regulatory protein